MDVENYANLGGLENIVILYGMNVIYALALLVVGWWAAGFVQRVLERALNATHRVDATVVNFLASLARYFVIVIVALAVLQLFGIQTTSVIAVLGAASLAIGLALQGTLSNLAAGVMLLLFRPFRVGDSVEVAGRAGTVRSLTLFTTEIASGDNVQVLVPNGQVWGAAIVNNSAYGTRRVDLTLEMKADKNLGAAMDGVLDGLRRDKRVLASPAASATIGKMLLDKVEVTFSAWSSSADVGAVKADLVAQVRRALYETGAETPAATPPTPRVREEERAVTETRPVRRATPAGQAG